MLERVVWGRSYCNYLGSAEAHAVAVPVGIRSLVIVTVGIGVADLAEDDHAGWAAINAQRAAGADIVVDSEDDVVGGVESGLFGTDCFVDC